MNGPSTPSVMRGVTNLLETPVVSLSSWVEQWSQRSGTAITFEGRAIYYPDLAAGVDATAAELADRGVEHGDRVAYCGLNRVEVIELFFACARLGVIFCPLNNRLTATELAGLMREARPRLAVVADGLAGTVTESAPDLEVIDLDRVALHGPDPRGIVAVGELDDPVLMVFTSGTTGVSKGAVLTQSAVAYTSRNSIAHQGFDGDDVTLSVLPNFHVGGLNIQTLPALEAGGEVVLERRFDPVRVLDLLVERPVTQVLLVPAMLTAVASLPGFERADLSGLKGVNTGSSLVPDAATRPWFAKGISVGEVYGATETGPTSVVLDFSEAADHRGSCGLPALHTEIRLVTAEGSEAAVGEAGEIWVCGPHLFSHYWEQPEATAEALVDGWYRTGDVGYQDDAGYLFISDRLKDVIISGGENIYPAEVEGVLGDHRAIAEVAVVGRPDPRWQEAPIAVVVLVPGAELTLDQLRDWAGRRLARYKLPRDLVVATELPRTALGKVQKHVLREQLGIR